MATTIPIKLDGEPDEINYSTPFMKLQAWLSEAIHSGQQEPTAMSLSTVTSNGEPRSRIVLLKELNDRGLRFFTNYESDKGSEIEANPRVALLLFWPLLERQVRVEGVAFKVPEADSDAYFATRPRENRIGAWASPQSRTVASHHEIELRYKMLEREFENREIPRPPYWGGYEVTPSCFEFWEAKPGRLHHRQRYRLTSGAWVTETIAP